MYIYQGGKKQRCYHTKILARSGRCRESYVRYTKVSDLYLRWIEENIFLSPCFRHAHYHEITFFHFKKRYTHRLIYDIGDLIQLPETYYFGYTDTYSRLKGSEIEHWSEMRDFFCHPRQFKCILVTLEIMNMFRNRPVPIWCFKVNQNDAMTPNFKTEFWNYYESLKFCSLAQARSWIYSSSIEKIRRNFFSLSLRSLHIKKG